MTRKSFEYQGQVSRIWTWFLDGFARRTRGYHDISNQMAQEVNRSAGEFSSKLGGATRDLPQQGQQKSGEHLLLLRCHPITVKWWQSRRLTLLK